MNNVWKSALLGALSCVWALSMSGCLPEVTAPSTGQSGDAGRADDGGSGDGGGLSDGGDAGDAGACAQECGYGEYCVAGECQACPETFATMECADEGAVCLGNVLQQCSTGPDGCPQITVEKDCAADGEACIEGVCTPCADASGCTQEDQRTCTPEGLVAECQFDDTLVCFEAVALGAEEQCPQGEYCQGGGCTSCADLGMACETPDALACAGEDDRGTVLRCQDRNGCLVMAPDPDLACDLGEACDPNDPEVCTSCVDLECDGRMANDKALCLPGVDPGAFAFCEDTGNGCLVLNDTGMCDAGEFCDEMGGGPSCDTCESEFPGMTCENEGETRCAPVGGSGPSEGTQVCKRDAATGCLTWDETQLCDVSGFGQVCVPAGTPIDPRNPGSTRTEAACVDNECDTEGAQSCSPQSDIETCTRVQTTGLLYLDPTTDCTENQLCDDTGDPNIKACVCQHECTMGELGDVRCGSGGRTEFCQEQLDGCRVYVEETTNRCNPDARANGDAVECIGTPGVTTQINVCTPFEGSCLRPVANTCPCLGIGFCNQQTCQPAPTNFPDGQARFECD